MATHRKRNNPVQPTCPHCSEPMKLARVARFKAYAEIQDRTYECQNPGTPKVGSLVSTSPKPTGGKVLTTRLRNRQP